MRNDAPNSHTRNERPRLDGWLRLWGWPQTMQYRVVSSNGQYFMGNAPYPQYASQSSMRAAPPPVADQTCARVNTTTITNAVMLEKASLKVTRDPTVRARCRALAA
jgi:hypothetical protein